jgi:hypothetical protein
MHQITKEFAQVGLFLFLSTHCIANSNSFFCSHISFPIVFMVIVYILFPTPGCPMLLPTAPSLPGTSPSLCLLPAFPLHSLFLVFHLRCLCLLVARLLVLLRKGIVVWPNVLVKLHECLRFVYAALLHDLF